MCGPEPPASCPDGCAQCTPQPQGGRVLTDDPDQVDLVAHVEARWRAWLGDDAEVCGACSGDDHAHCARRIQLPGEVGWLTEGCCCGVLV
jgi:hypothetical protein